jgi:hypothetical protein
LFILAMNEYSSRDTSHLHQVEYFDGQALVRNQSAMRCKHLLSVARLLHGPEYLFEIPAHAPNVRLGHFCQAHLLKHYEAGNLRTPDLVP